MDTMKSRRYCGASGSRIQLEHSAAARTFPITNLTRKSIRDGNQPVAAKITQRAHVDVVLHYQEPKPSVSPAGVIPMQEKQHHCAARTCFVPVGVTKLQI